MRFRFKGLIRDNNASHDLIIPAARVCASRDGTTTMIIIIIIGARAVRHGFGAQSKFAPEFLLVAVSLCDRFAVAIALGAKARKTLGVVAEEIKRVTKYKLIR